MVSEAWIPSVIVFPGVRTPGPSGESWSCLFECLLEVSVHILSPHAFSKWFDMDTRSPAKLVQLGLTRFDTAPARFDTGHTRGTRCEEDLFTRNWNWLTKIYEHSRTMLLHLLWHLVLYFQLSHYWNWRQIVFIAGYYKLLQDPLFAVIAIFGIFAKYISSWNISNFWIPRHPANFFWGVAKHTW